MITIALNEILRVHDLFCVSKYLAIKKVKIVYIIENSSMKGYYTISLIMHMKYWEKRENGSFCNESSTWNKINL